MSRRARTILLAIAVAVVALAVAVPVVVWLLLDARLVRAQASRYVQEQTGRELRLDGPIGLSLYPFLGAELHDVTLGHPGQRGGPAFARFEEVDLRVKLLPLLQRVIDVGGIRATGGAVSLPGYDLRDVRLRTGAFGGTQETDLSLEFTLVAAGGRAVPTRVEGPMVFNIPAQTLELRETTGRIGDMTFSGALRGKGIFDAPAFEADVRTGTFDLRTLLANLGVSYRAVDPKALTSASLSAQVSRSSGRLDVRNLLLSLDGSTFKGRATGTAAAPGARTSWDAALTGDRFEVDRYMPGPAGSAVPEAAADPYAALRELVARVDVQVGQVRAFGLHLENARASLAARDGMVTAAPIATRLYSGSGALAARMDVRGKVPAYHVEGRFAGVSVQPLLQDAQQITALSGTGDLSLRLDAATEDLGRLIAATRGEVGMSVRDGRIEGADFLKLLAQGRALSDQIRGREVTTQSDPADRTKFSRLTATATLQNGVARSDDLALQAPDLQAAGGGTIDLVRETIDLVVRARSDQAGNVLVPIGVAGPFGRPAYHVRAGELLRQAAEDELKKQLERRLRGLIRIP
jgi:AsmA protein